MQQNAVNAWRQKWDNLNSTDFDKVMELLFAYAGSFRHLPFTGIKYVWGGQFGRFFSAKFNHQYGDIVQQTLRAFHDQDTLTCIYDELNSVLNLISHLKHNFGATVLNSDDDLYAVLAVVAEKTGVNFVTVDPLMFDNACRQFLNSK